MRTYDMRLCMAWSVLISALAYLVYKSVIDPGLPVDFQFIWLAGDMWLNGMDPYSDQYHQRAEVLFSGQRVPGAWYYPPNWWPISSFVALAPFQESIQYWRAINAILLVASCALLSLFARNLSSTDRLLTFSILTFLASWFSATPIALSLGQTSLVIFCGVSLFLVSQITKNRFLAAIAIIILLLKPQIGIPFSAFLLMNRYWWPSIGVGAAVTAVFAAPALGIVGLTDFFSSYQSIMERYEGHEAAHPANMTGLRTVVFVLSDLKLSVLATLTISSIAAAIVGWKTSQGNNHQSVALFALIAILAFLVPLHYYDLTFVTLACVFFVNLPRGRQLIVVSCLLVLLRANNLEAVLGLTLDETTFAGGSWLATLALFVLGLVGMSLLVWPTAARSRETQRTG